MDFAIYIDLDCNNIYRDKEGNPLLFRSHASAKKTLEKLKKNQALQENRTDAAASYFIKPFVDESWKVRERKRFEKGIYKVTPFHSYGFYADSHEKYFAHMSKEQDGVIAFTETPEKGMNDIQTRIRPERFISKFFPEFYKESSHKEWFRELIAECLRELPEYIKLQILHDANEIVDFYIRIQKDGSSLAACMSYPTWHEDYPHPCSVYGKPSDISLATLYDGEKGKYIARCLVFRRKKVFGRVYGNKSLMGMALEKMGYKEKRDNEFHNAKLKLIVMENEDIICPYIDSSGMRYPFSWVKPDYKKNILRIKEPETLAKKYDGGAGNNFCDKTSGYVFKDYLAACAVWGYVSYEGANRGYPTDPYSREYIDNEDEIDNLITCDRCDGRFHEEDTYYMDNENLTLCRDCKEDAYFYCDSCQDDYFRDGCDIHEIHYRTGFYLTCAFNALLHQGRTGHIDYQWETICEACFDEREDDGDVYKCQTCGNYHNKPIETFISTSGKYVDACYLCLNRFMRKTGLSAIYYSGVYPYTKTLSYCHKRVQENLAYNVDRNLEAKERDK